MKPNIVIVVWDAVRAKNLPFYGYTRNTTPNLLEMEKELAIYRNAISSSYWTLPSITSLFTGMYPSAHGLVVDGDKLNPRFMSLPEILQKEGYYCAAFNRNPYVSAFTGLDRGFHHFVADSKCLWDYLKKIEKKLKRKFSTDPSFNPERSSRTKATPLMHVLSHLPDAITDSGSGGLVKQFTEWINNLDRRPFFAFFQTVETHRPYRAPLTFGLKFLSVSELVRKIFINQDHLAFALGDSHISTDQFRILRNGYDNSIRYCDFITRQICRLLKACKVYDDTLLIIMADHGESIGEHNLMFHVWSLYDNLIKVPLIIKYPRDIAITGPVEKIVQNVDIFSTICSLLGTKYHFRINQIQGNNILDETDMNREPDLAISELIKPFGPEMIVHREQLAQYDRRLVSLRTTDRKFIYSSRGDHEFYNLAKDPEESENLYDTLHDYGGLDEKAKYHYQNIQSFYEFNRARIEGQENILIEDEDVKEQLKHLGYL